MASENLHEPAEALSNETKDMHRAIVSLMEELEAVDWYGQRAEACTDDELRSVLVHNKNEEIEHAMMVLEWIRRKNPVFDENIGTYIRAKGPITAVEEKETSGGGSAGGGAASKAPSGGKPRASQSGPSQSLGIGSLK